MSRKSTTPRLPPNSPTSPRELSRFVYRKKSKSGVQNDYLSTLPVALIITIISLLPLKEAVRTSMLSTSWRELWKLVPLRLDDSSLYLENPAKSKREMSNYSRGEDGRLQGTISTVLSLQKKPIEYCHLSCFDHPVLFSTLDGFLRQLSAKNIKHLNISLKKSWWKIQNMYMWQSEIYEGYRLAKRAYELPKSILQCKTLTKLELLCCCVPKNISQMSIFPNLIDIRLICVFISDTFMECLFSSNSKLEKMSMHCCCGPKKIQINSNKLRELEIIYGVGYPYVNLEEFYIDHAPNLEALIHDDTPDLLATKKMKMRIYFSKKVKKLGMTCSLNDYCFIDD